MNSLVKLGPYKVNVQEAGDSTGPAFVLVHGAGMSSRYFGPLIGELSLFARVFALDLPGFGQSPKPNHVLDLAELAEVVHLLIKHEQLQDVTVAGHSMGCQVAMELARIHPDDAKRLVLIGPAAGPLRGGPLGHFARLVLNSLREPFEVNKITFQEYLKCGHRRYIQTLGHMFSDHIESKRPQGRVLVVRGQHDAICDSSWARQLIRNNLGMYKEIPHGAHNIQFTHPRELAGVCLVFAEGLDTLS